MVGHNIITLAPYIHTHVTRRKPKFLNVNLETRYVCDCGKVRVYYPAARGVCTIV